ncbi:MULTISPECIES: GNAT family N-acetyltransferase [Paracoccus]|uniref:L-ornithine N(alpha)-acyltransferase n=1 Tax=Paracoccus aerius TaxID=1915382 RepID=A0ABS1S0K5_9RHOB|nr:MULTISPECIES: GNAT family N-acyltransferase [Paracoccus]MBL3672237.1 GNAT family N-acetyltransferase [Paracoccus aerius]QIR86009.1 GNAT family N-acetyltransferase [Paracoccus sp. AK26]GHG12069.1 ornithine-acyl-ACP acyltransferase [Paracoccus aerius]
MTPFRKGRYLARLAASADDLRRAQRLRWLCFVARDGDAASGDEIESDAHDDRCGHMLISDAASGRLVCCFRFLPLPGGRDIGASYSAQFYDLGAFEAFDSPLVEVGRFCVHPHVQDPDVIRLAWAALTRVVEATGARMLFGCSSFRGTDPADHAQAFALLQARHLAPRRWWPRIKAPHVFRLARAPLAGPHDPRRAMAGMPPLLRSYLALGGWVSDHAVVDASLGTMHVFTAVETAAIPPARRQRLLASASQAFPD